MNDNQRLAVEALRTAADVIEAGGAEMLLKPHWRDIESAPKDGTPILTFGEEDGQFVAICIHCNDGGWYWANTGEEFGLLHPTHWMPLPELPKGYNAEAQGRLARDSG